jgi:hypothetical protein
VSTTLSLTLFDLNNLCCLVLARFVLFFRLAKLCIDIDNRLCTTPRILLDMTRLPKFPHTVEPVLRGTVLSGHALIHTLLSVHVAKSRNFHNPRAGGAKRRARVLIPHG